MTYTYPLIDDNLYIQLKPFKNYLKTQKSLVLKAFESLQKEPDIEHCRMRLWGTIITFSYVICNTELLSWAISEKLEMDPCYNDGNCYNFAQILPAMAGPLEDYWHPVNLQGLVEFTIDTKDYVCRPVPKLFHKDTFVEMYHLLKSVFPDDQNFDQYFSYTIARVYKYHKDANIELLVTGIQLGVDPKDVLGSWTGHYYYKDDVPELTRILELAKSRV